MAEKKEKTILKNTEKIFPSCENHQQAAEHYNEMIWWVFSIGAGVALWSIYQHLNNAEENVLVLPFGFIVLIYSFVLVFSFSQKKKIHYEEMKKKPGEIFPYGKRYLHVRHLGTIILFLIIVAYASFLINNFIENFSSGNVGPTYWYGAIAVFIVIIFIAYNIGYSWRK